MLVVYLRKGSSMKHYFADVCQKFLMLPVQLPSSRGYSCLNAFLPTQDLQLRNHFLAGVMAVSPLTELSSSLLDWSCSISDAEITLLCSTTKAAWVQQIEAGGDLFHHICFDSMMVHNCSWSGENDKLERQLPHWQRGMKISWSPVEKAGGKKTAIGTRYLLYIIRFHNYVIFMLDQRLWRSFICRCRLQWLFEFISL